MRITDHGNSTFRVLSTEELTAVLGTIRHYGPPADRPRRYALFVLLANYVCRVGEVLALRGEDIDWARKRITLLTLKRRRPMHRTLPLYPVAESALRACGITESTTGRLFHWDRKSVHRTFQICLRRAQIAHRRLHDLRHTVASRLADATRDPYLLRDAGGWANITTPDLYVHPLRFAERLLDIPTVQ